MFRFSLAIAALATFAVGVPCARAQNPLAEATGHYEDAEFEAALSAIAAAEEAGPLDRAQYVDLLRLRATILFALGRGGWRRDLRLIAAVDAEAELGPESPPPLHREFDAIRTATRAIELNASADASEDGVELSAEARWLPRNLAAIPVVFGRVEGGEWEQGETRLRLPLVESAIEYYAHLVGPGESVLLRAGSRADPLRYEPPVDAMALPESTSAESGDPSESNDDSGPSGWVWATVIGGVVVAAAAVVVISLAVQEPETRVTLPDPP